MAATATVVHMPSVNSREAPRFVSDPTGFDLFFDQVEEFGVRAAISEADKIKWAIRYGGSEAESWKYVDCLAGANAPTFAQFRAEVLKCYPNLSADRRYTHTDLARLLDSVSAFREMSKDDLGTYLRKFIPITAYLMRENRMSERERDAAYLRGFPQQVRSRILQRLSIKKPDVVPIDGYKFADVQEAALFVMDAVSSAAPYEMPSPSSTAATIAKTEPTEQGSLSELIQAMSSLTRVFTASAQNQQFSPRPPRPSFPTPGGVAQNPPRWQRGQSADSFVRNCLFCSDHDHLVRDCPSAAEYLRISKIVRDENGRLNVPGGANLSRYPGKNLRERVENYWKEFFGPDGPPPHLATVSTNFLEGPEECVFSIDIDPVPAANPSGPTSYDEAIFEAQLLQTQIDSLREAQALALEKGKKKLQFDGVQIMKRTGPPKPNTPIPPPPFNGPTVHARGPVPTRERVPSSSQPAIFPPNVNGKPGTRAGDNQPQRPQGPMRPVTIPPKPTAEDPKFRYHSAVESALKPNELANRALDATITISTRELLAASPDVRRQVKDLVTSKKVSANSVEVDEVDAYLTNCLEPIPSAVYLDLFKYDSSALSAAASLPLRVIFPTFAPGVEPECILDGGAQVVVMRRDIWEKLNVPIAANLAMPMESANASTTMTLGLIENHPVQLGPVTIYLQIQVVENAPFEVLLGRPFFDVVSCSEISSTGGNHEIRIKDPKTGHPYVFATQPRTRKTPSENSDPRNHGNVNFRQ
jgi:hypothetical protein